MLVGLRSLSLDEDEELSELPEQFDHEESEEESTPSQESAQNQESTRAAESQVPTMSTATTGPQNGVGTEAARVPNDIVMAATSYPLIKTFRGKEGEDVERFLKNVSRYIELKVLNGMYMSDMEQRMDHVTLIYSHCAHRVQEYIDTMDGEWEVNPTVVQEGLLCRYRRMRDTGVEDDVNPMDGLRQKPNETFRRYIQRTQKLAGLCKGRDNLYESLTSRFCRRIRDGVNRKTLISVPGIREQKGKIRFETCMAYAHGLAGTEEEPGSGRRWSAYFDSDDSDDSSDSDSDDSSDSDLDDSSDSDSDSDSCDDERDRRRRKGKDRKYRKSLRKRKERRNDKASEKLAELQRVREEEIRTKEEARKKEEEARAQEAEARKKEEEVRKKEEEFRLKEDAIRKEKEVFQNQQEVARKQMEELQRQLDEMKLLKIQGSLGYVLRAGRANLVEPGNLIEAGRPEWTGNPNMNLEIICYNCEGVGHYESRCWKPRVHPEIRAENIQRINAETARRRPFQPRYGQPGERHPYGQPERRLYVPPAPEHLLEGPRRDSPQPDSQLRQELEELRQQMRDMQRERQPQQAQKGQGTDHLVQGTGSNRQALGSGRLVGRAPDNLVTMIATIETGDVEPDPKEAYERQRAVSDGELGERGPQAKCPILKPVGSGRSGRAIPEDDLANRSPIMTSADLSLEPADSGRPGWAIPEDYLADPPPFLTAADFYETPKRKRRARKDRDTTQMPLDRYEKMGDASSEPIGRIVNFYRMDQVIDEEPSDEDSGNGFRHEVPGLRVAARMEAARFQKN